jgi:hypothetical protein
MNVVKNAEQKASGIVEGAIYYSAGGFLSGALGHLA